MRWLRGTSRRLRTCALGAVAVGLAGVAAASADAATIPAACSGGPSALTAAIAQANSASEADTIDITGGPCTFTYTVPAGSGAAGTGNDSALPIVTAPLTILGHGSTIARSSATGTPTFRLLLASSTALALRDLTFSGGKLTNANVGAGLALLDGSATLDNVVLQANSTQNGNGAGLWEQGATVTLDHVTSISNTTSTLTGGGSGAGAAFVGGTATIDHSLFQFNSAMNAGAILAVSATSTVRHSAIVVNSATRGAGAMLVQGGNATLENDTIASNLASDGTGGLTVTNNVGTQGTATVRSVTFADSSRPNDTAPGTAIATCFAACGGSGTAPVMHVRDSIVTDTDSTAAALSPPCSTGLGGTIVYDGGNIEFPTSSCTAMHADPRLVRPASGVPNTNGGSTFNYRLAPDSPAIDLAQSCLDTDQRDLTRPGGDGCDAGAYESHPPQTTATGPNGLTRSPQVAFSADESGSTFQCSIDGATYAACSSPFSPAGLRDGSHTVAAKASAADPTSSVTTNNVYTDASPAVVSFVVDRTAPQVDLTSAPPSATTDSTPSIAFAATDPNLDTVTCQVDSGAPTGCSSPFTPDALADGSHTVTVRATDLAGNTSSAAATFTVDTIAPDTVLTGGPSGSVDTDFASFSFMSDDAASKFECRLDDGDFAKCVSPDAFAGLTEGQHTFTVRAVDGAGNADPSPASSMFIFVKDTTAPDVQITSSPTSPTTDATPPIGFTVVDTHPGTVTCQVDDGAPAPCASPFTPDALADGPHTVTVTATDASRNSRSDSVTFTVDTTAPDTVLTEGPNATVYRDSATFSFDSNDTGADFECRLDDGEFVRCTSPHTVSGLSEGQHTVAVRAIDAAGNVDATPASRTFTFIDTPTITLADGNPATVEEGSAERTFTYSIDDLGGRTVADVSDTCGENGTRVVDADEHTDAGGSFRCVFADGPATSNVRVKVTDSDGRTSDVAAQTVAVTNAAPVVKLDADNPATVGADAAERTFRYSISDPGADTINDVATTCGDNGVKVPRSDTYTDTGGSFRCVFAHGYAESTVSAEATDSDGESAADTELVEVLATQTIDFPAPAERAYGDAPFSVAPTASSGLPVSLSASGACALRDGQVAILAAGTCRLTAEQAGDSRTEPAARVERSLDIAQRALMLTGNHQTRLYGDDDPALTGSITAGLLPGDDVTATWSTEATKGSPPGRYATTPSLSGADAANYRPDVTPGELTVERRPLEAAADDISRPFATDNPPLTGHLTGRVAGDDVTVRYSTTATRTSKPGRYPIHLDVVGSDAVLANYDVTTHDGELTVVDENAPTLVVPSTVVAEATGPAGAAVDFGGRVSARDDAVDDPELACDPASGATFRIGTTTITCMASDGVHITTQRFTVEVTDTTAPELSLPTGRSVDATTSAGAPVTWTATATDVVDGAVPVTCTPAAGSTFAVGDRTVSCSAVDAHGNRATATFVVHVKGESEQLSDLAAAVTASKLPTSTADGIVHDLADVRDRLAAGNRSAACGKLGAVSNKIAAKAGKDGFTTAAADAMLADLRRVQTVAGC